MIESLAPPEMGYICDTFRESPMPSVKTCFRCLVVLFLLPVVTSACDRLGTVFIETVPGRPFTADVAITHWSTGEDGERTPDTPQIEHVARDRYGRVWHAGSGFPAESTILDPVAHNMISLLTGEDIALVRNPVTGREEYVTKILNRGASVIEVNSFGYCAPWPPDLPTFDYSKREPSGLRDVGWQTVSGVRLHGFRVAISGKDWLPLTMPERLEEKYAERYRTEPDDLRADRLVIYRWSAELGSRMELTNIKLVEPDSSLFRIPSNYKIETEDEFRDEYWKLREAFESSAKASLAARTPKK